MGMRSIDVSIGTLSLEGVEGLDAAHVGASVRRSLQRLATTRPLPQRLHQDARVGALRIADVSIPAGAGEGAIGSAIAEAVWRGLGDSGGDA